MDPTAYNPWATPIFPGASAFGVGSPAEAAERQPTIVDNLLSHIAGALGRGFMAPGQALQSTTPLTSEQMIAPAQDMSTMMSAGSGAMPASANELRMGIKAYHGSPHDFDAFDLSKIGTGEGAQAYGHGLYFAEAEPVAKMYRDNLARPQFTHTGSGVPISSDMQRILEDSYNDAMNVHGVRSPSGNDAVHLAQQKLERQRGDALKANDFDWYNKIADQQAELARMGKDAPKSGGKMYEVNINAEPEHFLDWDKPLSQQPELFGRLKDAGIINDKSPPHQLSGQATPKALFQMPVDKGSIEGRVSDLGIPGIKYLDQGSRSTGQGSSNYVVFNDKLIDIMRKYAIPGMIGAPIFANSMGENKQ